MTQQDKNNNSKFSVAIQATTRGLNYFGRGADHSIRRIGAAGWNALDGASQLPGAIANNLGGVIWMIIILGSVGMVTGAWVLTTYRTTGAGEPAEALCRDIGGVVRSSTWNEKGGLPLPGGNTSCYPSDTPPGAEG
jgi:hypothetical protein